MIDTKISPATHIIVKGARQHNLKNVSINIPKNQLVVFTGVSGSGKSSLAFDTIYAEGQRRYVESLSSYARQFLGVMDKPEVDLIDGLSPAISIDQKSGSHNPRSTVGTVTEVYDYFRLLFARIGHPFCPRCGREISTQDVQTICKNILSLSQQHPKLIQDAGIRIAILAPVVRNQKGQFKDLFTNLKKKGYQRVRVDGRFYDMKDVAELSKTNFHQIDVVVDRLVLGKSDFAADSFSDSDSYRRLFESIETSLSLSDGLVIAAIVLDQSLSFPDQPQSTEDHLFSEKFACPHCNISLPEIEPRTFSFNSPDGACSTCTGLGTRLTVNPELLLAPSLSLNEGAIIPIASQFESNTWLARLIKTVAHKHGFSETDPINHLTPDQRQVLLQGTGETIHDVEGLNSQGRPTVWSTVYRGIIPELERRYQETSSDFVRNELERFMIKEDCPSCKGKRLKPESLSITIDAFSIADISRLSIDSLHQWVEILSQKLTEKEQTIAAPIITEIRDRLSFLVSVGLSYLNLHRESDTLAGGELQRIRLASQIGSRLTGIVYILDEPTIGLHERDNKKLINTLRNLQSLGNTLIIVEHDRETINNADHLVEFGPGAGDRGGSITFQGTVPEIKKDLNSITGQYLSYKKTISHPQAKRKNLNGAQLSLYGASDNNLKNIDLHLPLGKFIGITGVSGSGKSTLIVQTLHEALARKLNKQHRHQPCKFTEVDIPAEVRRVSLIDQSPIGRTPRSNPATYTKSFDYIRSIFANTAESRSRGFTPGRFSFNVKGGRCEACQGDGQIKIEMQFMADLYVTCDVCHGSRYNLPTLEIEYKGKNIAQILDLTVDEALGFFKSVPGLNRRLETLKSVGLGYIRLGQSATTLSGGEAQRIKLATELAKINSGHTIYIMDEPTTGLHFEDLNKLIQVLNSLVDLGHTVVVIEHNLDLIKNVDHVVDLGPEGGDAGGFIVAQGTPKEITENTKSVTGVELRALLK